MSRRRARRNRLIGTILIVVVVSFLWGLTTGIYLVPSPPPKEIVTIRVFHVVIYHWGFVFYDWNDTEVDRIMVNKNDYVALFVTASTSLRDETRSKLEERTIQQGIGELPPGDPRIREKIDEAAAEGLTDFALAISEHEFVINAPKNSTHASYYRFPAFRPGEYDILNVVPDGYGYDYHIREGAFVVRNITTAETV